MCSAKSHTSQLNLPGLQDIGGPTDQVCVRQEKSVEVQCAVGMQDCCAGQQELRSTERKSSTRFTQTFGRVHRQKAGEGPYGCSGISSLDRYYHRSSIGGRLTAKDNVHELLSRLGVYKIDQSARARLSTSPADEVGRLL